MPAVLVIYVLPILAQVVLPLLLLWWATARQDGRSGVSALQVAATGLYLLAIDLTGLWLVTPGWLLYGYWVGWIAALFRWMLDIGGARVGGRRPLTAPAAAAVAVGSTLVICAALIARRPPPAELVDLSFPLRGGTYYIVNGGNASLVNFHLLTQAAGPHRRARGQRYGVDIVRLNGARLRAAGFAPSEPEAYAIFGDPVFAPCDGRVVSAEDGLPDMPVPSAGPANLAGNHVVIACGGVRVVIAHLRQGSVRVRPGQTVMPHDRLGLIGNSSHSNEPHLHIHAQRPPAPGAAPLSGEPLPIRIEGRYLVRNDRIRR